MKTLLEESFEYSLHNFLQWLEVLKMGPIEACDAWGNYNVAWEIISDLKVDGNQIIMMPCSYLSKEQKLSVSSFISKLTEVPDEVLVSAVSAEANYHAMSHSCWISLRECASALMEELDSAAIQNKIYFHSLHGGHTN